MLCQFFRSFTPCSHLQIFFTCILTSWRDIGLPSTKTELPILEHPSVISLQSKLFQFLNTNRMSVYMKVHTYVCICICIFIAYLSVTHPQFYPLTRSRSHLQIGLASPCLRILIVFLIVLVRKVIHTPLSLSLFLFLPLSSIYASTFINMNIYADRGAYRDSRN